MFRNGLSLLIPVMSVCLISSASNGKHQADSQASSKPQAAPRDSANSASSPSASKSNAASPPAAVTQDLPSAAWKLLEAGVTSEKIRTRSDAISALAILDLDPKAIFLTAMKLEDKEDSIRALAAASLGDIKARSAIPALKKALDDPAPQVSFAAAQALWKMDDRSGRDIFYAVLDGDRKTGPGLIQSKVQKAKQEMHDPKALALIGINQASGAFLGPFSMGVSMLEDYARNTSAPVQAICAQMLAADNSRRTVEELEDALWDKNWAVRAAAARAVAKINDRKAMPQLKEMMENDKQEAARLAAAAAIIRLSLRRSTVDHRPPVASVPGVSAGGSAGTVKRTALAAAKY